MEINAVIRSPVENMVGVLISQGKTKILWGVKRLNTKGKIISISTMSFSYRLPSSKTLKLVISKKKKKGSKTSIRSSEALHHEHIFRGPVES